MRSKEEWERERQERKQQVQREQAVQEEMSAQESSDEEECEFVGPWVAKGNPPGFLDSADEAVLGSVAVTMAKKVKNSLHLDSWRSATEFLLEQIVDFTEDTLVETEPKMKKYDLLLRVLGMHGASMYEARQEFADLVQKAVCERDDNYGRQDDKDDRIEALEGVKQGLREQLATLTTESDSELQAKLAEITGFNVILVDQKLTRDKEDAMRKREFEEESRDCEEKWKKWAEKEAQLKTGRAVSAERKKWQAKGKALLVEMVTSATQTQPEEEKAKPTLVTAEV